jgi:predicted DsbA family dithiol-disulfide isomerase
MSSTEDADAITVYSDYVCPFCYLGRESLDTYLEDRTDRPAIDWHPFDLRSRKRRPDGANDHAVDDGKDEAYFDRVSENVDRLREEYGAAEMLGIDEVPEVDSLDAQVASAHVEREHPDDWLAFDEALFDALWVEGRDVGDPDVIADVAGSVGLDGDEVRDAIRDERLREDVFDEFAAAQQRGVTGVPTFVYEGTAARGAVPPEHLRRLVEGE